MGTAAHHLIMLASITDEHAAASGYEKWSAVVVVKTRLSTFSYCVKLVSSNQSIYLYCQASSKIYMHME